MSVTFTIRGNDILRLKSALLRSRHPEPDKCWNMFIEVTPSVASFRFGGTSVEYPVDGKSPGYAKFSEELFRNSAHEFPHKNPPREISVEICEGRICFGDGHSNGDVEVGYFRHPADGKIVYLKDAELSALGTLLADATIQGVDLRPRIVEANDAISRHISFAYHHLKHCGFLYEEVKELVHHRIAEMAALLKAQFATLGVNTWKS